MTPAEGPANSGSMYAVRSAMGRNRKGLNVQRFVGRLAKAKAVSNGPLYGVVELQFETRGMSCYSVFLKLYAGSSRVDVSVRFHKESVWEPENVYISLPFTSGLPDAETLWLDKAGAPSVRGSTSCRERCWTTTAFRRGWLLREKTELS
ncbi:hypothetical protein CM49_02656 [Paenibacillus sp. P1XP2]|nr:hypothetical protein CM49_02656 [Paenibacillus sp. P1XP2]